ncbi:MAG TPA: CusA/CzcA family heavy metal efflux RND transporter [Kofleriaceae bacterium]|jgi:cobalt-zinc-cadmium resistance protein CzcA|nr:CusA/CzcA family heavy metal efflux RND transporter [Kofleriaceae bacterium]
MIDALLGQALRARMVVFVAAIAVIAFGYTAYKDLTIEAFPDPTDTSVQVITIYPGQPAEEVERRISIPLERALNGVPGTIHQRSISLFGLSIVTLTFEDSVDVLQARQQIVERMSDANLPPEANSGLGPLATPIGEVYRYTLESHDCDPMMLRTIQDWVVRPALLRAPGVAEVTSYGGLVKEIHVEPDPAKMAALGVVLDDLFQALNKASVNASGGLVERGEQGFVIRSVGTFQSDAELTCHADPQKPADTGLDDIGAVRVGYHNQVPITLKDVASVVVGYAPRQGVVSRQTNLDTVQGIVLMRKGQNPSGVLEGIRAKVAEIQKHALPPGVAIHAFYDRTDLVDTTLDTVFHNLAEGALLVTTVLFLFLLSVRASLVVALVIPLSLAASFIYLHFRGMSANLLSMGAVDFGIIVDGAVILVEHVFEHAAGPAYQQMTPERRIETIFQTARQVARPTLFSLLIIVAAYLPIFALQRVEGRIFAPMAHTVVSALIGAMVVSFTLVPVLCFFALRRHGKVRESPVLRVARRIHDPLLSLAMNNPLAVAVIAIGLLVGGWELAPRLGSEFLPELNEGSIYCTFTLPPTASLSDGRKLTPKIIALLRGETLPGMVQGAVQPLPEVTEVLSQLGRPEDGTDAKLFNNLEVFIKLRPMRDWRPNIHTLDDIVAIQAANLKAIPGLEYNFSQPIRDNVNENISGQQGQIAIKIYGDDVGQLRALAEQVENEVQKVPGIVDVGIVKAAEQPVIAVNPDRHALARWDQDLGSFQGYIETALSGHVASQLWEGEKKFDVTVRFPRSAREDLATIRELRVPLKDGSLIPVEALARVAMSHGPAAITRDNGKRYIGVRTNIRNRDLGSAIQEAQARVEQNVKFPTGYEITWGGEFENQERAMKRLQLVLPLSLLLTFFLLFSAFGSVWDAMLIIVNLPIALLGGLVGLGLATMTLSVSAAVGFIALLGQAVLNGVLVVSAIRARRDRGEDLWTATIEGTRERLRAILMTALLASLGLLPAAMSHAIGSETQRPIAMVVVSGTISAALLTLIVLPVSYYWAGAARQWLQRRWRTRHPIPGGLGAGGSHQG